MQEGHAGHSFIRTMGIGRFCLSHSRAVKVPIAINRMFPLLIPQDMQVEMGYQASGDGVVVSSPRLHLGLRHPLSPKSGQVGSDTCVATFDGEVSVDSVVLSFNPTVWIGVFGGYCEGKMHSFLSEYGLF